MKKYKVRIIAFVVVLSAWLLLLSILLPATTLVGNHAAVASMANSDAAFYAQRMVEDSTRFPAAWAGIAVIAFGFWYQPALNLFKR